MIEWVHFEVTWPFHWAILAQSRAKMIRFKRERIHLGEDNKKLKTISINLEVLHKYLICDEFRWKKWSVWFRLGKFLCLWPWQIISWFSSISSFYILMPISNKIDLSLGRWGFPWWSKRDGKGALIGFQIYFHGNTTLWGEYSSPWLNALHRINSLWC